MLALQQLLPLGSIDVHPYISKIANGSGKNFISVSVEKLGGDGVTIALPMNLQIGFPLIIVRIAILIMIASLVTSKLGVRL
jgi:hypothetical protein